MEWTRYGDVEFSRNENTSQCIDYIVIGLFVQVLPGLYVGNYRDSKDHQQLEKHRITHIVAIHDSPRRLIPVSSFSSNRICLSSEFQENCTTMFFFAAAASIAGHLQDKHYLCIMASDTPDQNLSQYFPVCNDFIHAARLRDGNVLIHCLAGMSRSVTVAVAYIMSVTNLSWSESLKVVRSGRSVANPNHGFQVQLQDYELYKLADVSSDECKPNYTQFKR